MAHPAFRIDRERVAGESPAEAAWRAIERIYDELKTPYEPDDRFDALTQGQRALYVLHWVQSELRNGGFEQMYENPSGRFAALAPDAARLRALPSTRACSLGPMRFSGGGSTRGA